MNILFLNKNIVDPSKINFAEICKLPLSTGLSVIGYRGFGNFLQIFQNLLFFGFHSKKYPLKVNSSQNVVIEFGRKQIMPKNQACNRLYSDKVSKL